MSGARVWMEVRGRFYEVVVAEAVELAIAMEFGRGGALEEGPRAFGLPWQRAEAFEVEGFVGDRRRGGSANCETLTITPHGNGTHTEGVGHILRERVAVADYVVEPLVPAALLTVELVRLGESGEEYGGTGEEGDLVISGAALAAAAARGGGQEGFWEALVVRIAPHEEFGGPAMDHTGTNPPYFTDQAMGWVRGQGVEHLLVEVPSVDREADGGALTAHHRYFGEARGRTITEMIFVPGEVEDGEYALSLRFPRLLTDAAPSRPILYPLRERG